MELFFLILLLVLMGSGLVSGYPVAFVLPGASIITILAAAGTGLLFTGDTGAFFNQGGPSQWLSAGITNLRGVYWEPERDTLIAIPLFIFMGIMLQRSKIAEDLLITMANLFGPVRGGLGISVVFVGALLAATTGIVGATVVAMGLISLPAMTRNKYSQSLATGTIAASGTLGQIIPPSIVLIILADQLSSAANEGSNLRKALYKENTGEISMPSSFDVISTSAGEMFLGAFLPGLVLVALYMIYILVYAYLRPNAAPAVPFDGSYDRKFALKVFMSLVPPLLLIFLVLGSIMSGIATVNQAGAIGAAGALIMAGYRLTEGQKGSYHPAILCIISVFCLALVLANFDTNIKNMKDSNDVLGVTLAIIGTLGLVVGVVWSGIRALKINQTLNSVMLETAKATSLVFIILLGAAILTAAFRAFGGEHLVKEFLEGLPGGFWMKFFVVMMVVFILGFFLDFIEIAVVVVPIVAPILLADPGANITAVWLGVMFGLNIQTSFLTPPFGFALFYLRGIAPAAIKTINMYKGVVPFICLQILAIGLVAWSPALVNYLPNRVSLLSENSPPPRNPRLAYCVNQYVSEQIIITGDTILAGVTTARLIDLSILPKPMMEDTLDSYDQVQISIEALQAAEQVSERLRVASIEFAPIHRMVRALERDVRRFDKIIADLQYDAANDEDNSRAFMQEIAAVEAKKVTLIGQIPASWPDDLAEFRALQANETTAYRVYTRAAQDAYQPVATTNVILESNAALFALEDELKSMPGLLDANDPDLMVEVLEQFGRKFAGIEGVSDITSGVSKARRALKSRTPDPVEARALLDVAIAEFDDQKNWRELAGAQILPDLSTYEDLLRPTIGIRDQAKLTEEQALFVARCQSYHRDISLNF